MSKVNDKSPYTIYFYLDPLLSLELDPLKLKHFTREVLSLKKVVRGSFEFNFISNDDMRVLNKKHLNHDEVTDIITFNLGTTSEPIGDIYIAPNHALDNANHYQNSFKQEVRRLIIHGILHLLGYKDYTPEEFSTMEKEQEQLLSLVDTFDI